MRNTFATPLLKGGGGEREQGLVFSLLVRALIAMGALGDAHEEQGDAHSTR